MEESPKIFTLEDFQPLVGQKFTLAQEGLEETIEAELVEAKASPFEAAPDAVRIPFSILWRLNPIYEPPQCVCTATHDAIGSITLLFVPIEAKEEGFYMESVLN